MYVQESCCGLTTGENPRTDLRHTFTDASHLHGRCRNPVDVRPITHALYKKIKDATESDEFPPQSGLRICDSCRLCFGRWEGVPTCCALCNKACLPSESRALGSTAMVSEDQSTRVCRTCFSVRYHTTNSVKNPPVPTPTKKGTEERDRGRPSRAKTGMSGPAAKGITRGPICLVPQCDGAACKHKGMHLEHVVGLVEMPIMLDLLARVRCAHDDGACTGFMHPYHFTHGFTANAHIDMSCTECEFDERIQLQRDLLKVWSPNSVPETVPDRTEQSKRPNAIPVRKGDTYGGATREEVKAINASNTATSLKIALGGVCAGVKLSKLQSGLAMAGIVLPGDNVKKGGVERIIVGSAAEATKMMENMMCDHLTRRAAGKGPTIGSIKQIVASGDNGHQAARDAAQSA